MGDATNFYDVLNISKDASPDQIRKAYKELVRKWHPDKHPASSKHAAEAMFKAITEAYQALSGRGYRAIFCVYNNPDGGGGCGGGGKGEEPIWKSPSSLHPRHHRKSEERPSPLSRSARGNASSFHPTPISTVGATKKKTSTTTNTGTMFFQRKPPPIERKLECTLEELFRGCKKEVRYTRDVVGRNGIIKKEEVQTVRLKPGWKKGTKVTLEEKGDERPGSLPSDVVLVISEKEHPYFKRVGNDLVLKVEVPLVKALTGWSFSFRHLRGEKMRCSFESEIIFPGYEKVVKGEGMPLANQTEARGDLRIKFSIVFPKTLSEERKAELRFLLKGCT